MPILLLLLVGLAEAAYFMHDVMVLAQDVREVARYAGKDTEPDLVAIYASSLSSEHVVRGRFFTASETEVTLDAEFTVGELEASFPPIDTAKMVTDQAKMVELYESSEFILVNPTARIVVVDSARTHYPLLCLFGHRPFVIKSRAVFRIQAQRNILRRRQP